MSQEIEPQFMKQLRSEVEKEVKRQSQSWKRLSKQKDTQKSEQQQISLKQPVNIFLKHDQKIDKKVNIFAKDLNSINLFNNNSKPSLVPNIFEKAAKNIPLIEASQRLSDQNEQKKDLQQISGLETSEKIVKFKYYLQTIKLKDFKVRKFRVSTNPCKDEVNLSLQKLKDNEQKLFLIVRTRQTHIGIFAGIILRNVSKIEQFMGKQQNVKIDLINYVKQSDEKQIKYVKVNVKIQFQSQQQCNQFKQIVNSFLQSS